MPYLSEIDERESNQGNVMYEPPAEYNFVETFDASVGLMIDEGLSNSSMGNKDGFLSRNRLVNEKIKSGLIPKEIAEKYDYQDYYDYDGLANELKDPEIKNNLVLGAERNEMLRQRREYATEVQEGGPLSAQILGSLTGVSHDPLVVFTAGFGSPIAAVRGMSVLANIGRVAAGEALLSAGTEALIQPFVYSHKKAIDSPYSFEDAVTQIGAAALFGGAIGGGVQSISGLLKRTVNEVDNSIANGYVPDVHERDALDFVRSTHESMEDFRAINLEEVRTSIVDEARQELLPIAGNKLSKAEVKALESEVKDLTYKLGQVDDVTVADVGIVKGKKARQAKKDAVNLAEERTLETKQEIQDKLDIANQKLDTHIKASEAEASLSRLDQGIIPEKYQKLLDDIKKENDAPLLSYAKDKYIREERARLNTLLQDDATKLDAQSQLDLLDKGELPDTLKHRLKEDAKNTIELEKQYLREQQEATDYINNAPPKMERENKPRVKLSATGNNEAAVMKAHLDSELEKFYALDDSVHVVDMGDGKYETISGKEYMAKLKNDAKAVDTIRACYLG